MARHRRNTAKLGTEIERKAIKCLRGDGWVVHRTIRTSKRIGPRRWMSHSNDVFSCIDLVAKKGGERTRWIQILAHRGVGRKFSKLRRVPWTVAHDNVEVWRWVPGSGRKIDRRNGKLRPRMYFQVYRLDDGFRREAKNRVFPARAPAIVEEPVPGIG